LPDFHRSLENPNMVLGGVAPSVSSPITSFRSSSIQPSIW
jgi:hypothetical protein